MGRRSSTHAPATTRDTTARKAPRLMFRKKSDPKTHMPDDDARETMVDAGDAALVDSVMEDVSHDSGTPKAREHGPWDVSEISDDADRIDLGSLLIKGVPGLSMQVQVDEKTQRVAMVTLVLEDAAVQVQAFAAPRSGGIWDDVRPQIATTVTTSGGLVEEAQGPFGTELRARVMGPNKEMQPARFVGVDGPRWFLRGLFLGSAASPDGHEGLTAVFSNIAVSRGTEAKPSGEPLSLELPPQDEPAEVPDAPAAPESP